MVTLVVVLLVCASIVFLFFKYFPNNLLRVEVLAAYLFSTIPIQNYEAIFTLNTHFMKGSSRPSLFLSLELMLIVVYPIIVLYFLNIYVSLSSSLKKFLLYLAFSVIPVILERFMVWLDMLEFHQWPFTFSLISWMVIFLLMILFMKIFRSLLKKDDSYASP